MFILPALVIFTLFVTYPLMKGLYLSFFKMSMLEGTKKYIGLKNYFKAFNDPVFWIALRNNLLYAGSNIIFETGIGLLIASMLNRKWIKGRSFFRIVFLIPFILPGVGTAILWRLVFSSRFGLIRSILGYFGLESLVRPWLAEFPAALICVFMVSIWIFLGQTVVLLLAAMERIPVELYDASEIDGVNAVQRFFGITLPLIREMLTVIVGLTLIGSFTQFGLFYIMTGGGPLHSTEVFATWIIRNAFFLDNMGYSAALAVIQLFLVLVLTVIYIQIRGKGESYEY